MTDDPKKLYPRDIDLEFESDAAGRKTRLFYTKDHVEALGLPYVPGHCYKLRVSPDLIENPELARPANLAKQFFYYRGLAQRCYRTGIVKGYPYSEDELLTGMVDSVERGYIHKKILDWCRIVGWIKPYEIDLEKANNYLGGKYVDWHGFEMDEQIFLQWLHELIAERTHWGRKDHDSKKYAYQDYGITTGKRRVLERAKELKLQDIDFTGKTVLDVGCNLGMMTLLAKDRGARAALGVDLKPVIEAADMYRLYHNLPIDLDHDTLTPSNLVKYGKHDVVFFLAMRQSLGIPSTLKDITGEVLIYEGHENEDPAEAERAFLPMFKNVTHVGYTKDRGKRPVFHCKTND